MRAAAVLPSFPKRGLYGLDLDYAVLRRRGRRRYAERVERSRARGLTAELEHLRQEHRDLDAAIEALTHLGSADRLQIQRLKKRKLSLRDRLCFLDVQLTPDIIA